MRPRERGGHDGGCQHPGCTCTRYARSKASPVPYVLGHTFASNALAAGVGIERTYGHLVTGADESFRNRLDAFAARDGVEVASGVEGDSR